MAAGSKKQRCGDRLPAKLDDVQTKATATPEVMAEPRGMSG